MIAGVNSDITLNSVEILPFKPAIYDVWLKYGGGTTTLTNSVRIIPSENDWENSLRQEMCY